VACRPRRAIEAEESILGRGIDEESAEEAGAAAVASARPMPHNGYMVQIARTLVKRAILSCK
jgi:xanthine dehydrogenase YagS FAD-binding subunit